VVNDEFNLVQVQAAPTMSCEAEGISVVPVIRPSDTQDRKDAALLATTEQIAAVRGAIFTFLAT
jgi:hypothetical protein